ncbi:MAG: hypothetical protein SGJ27_31335 [Candidatus Melainabacteria bacterium]|nr:hypothetical protein [Candidatus Melainabacteria bacterium]
MVSAFRKERLAEYFGEGNSAHHLFPPEKKATIMSGPLLVAIIVLVLVSALPFLLRGASSSSGGGNRGSRRNQEEADRLIGQAEMQVQTGQLDSASALYSRATTLAVGAPLLMSEAHYGLFRVAARRRDLQGAVRQIDAALSFAPEWREYKPNFERLLESEKQRVISELS